MAVIVALHLSLLSEVTCQCRSTSSLNRVLRLTGFTCSQESSDSLTKVDLRGLCISARACGPVHNYELLGVNHVSEEDKKQTGAVRLQSSELCMYFIFLNVIFHLCFGCLCSCVHFEVIERLLT